MTVEVIHNVPRDDSATYIQIVSTNNRGVAVLAFGRDRKRLLPGRVEGKIVMGQTHKIESQLAIWNDINSGELPDVLIREKGHGSFWWDRFEILANDEKTGGRSDQFKTVGEVVMVMGRIVERMGPEPTHLWVYEDQEDKDRKEGRPYKILDIVDRHGIVTGKRSAKWGMALIRKHYEKHPLVLMHGRLWRDYGLYTKYPVFE